MTCDSFFGIGATIRTGREIQCYSYVYLLLFFVVEKSKKNPKKSNKIPEIHNKPNKCCFRIQGVGSTVSLTKGE